MGHWPPATAATTATATATVTTAATATATGTVSAVQTVRTVPWPMVAVQNCPSMVITTVIVAVLVRSLWAQVRKSRGAWRHVNVVRVLCSRRSNLVVFGLAPWTSRAATRSRKARALLVRSSSISDDRIMSTCYRPLRRLRHKTCVPVDATVLARRLPRASHTLSSLSVHVDWQSPRLDVDSLWRSFTGADVLATVASFLAVRHLARLLVSEKCVCNSAGVWEMLLRQVSHAVYAARVRSARASLAKMMCRTVCVWPAHEPAHGYIPGERLSSYRWCLDFSYRGCQVFSAVMPLTDLSARDLRNLDSLHRGNFIHPRRVANLLPLHRLPLSVLELLSAAWNRQTDPVPHSPQWWDVLQRRDEFDRLTMECSLWLLDTRAQEVVAEFQRDMSYGACTGNFRFYASEEFRWVEDDQDDDAYPDEMEPHVEGRVLEIWVQFGCISIVTGAYELSCSVQAWKADGRSVQRIDGYTRDDLDSWNPAEDHALLWERRRARPWDFMRALSGCTLRPAVAQDDV